MHALQTVPTVTQQSKPAQAYGPDFGLCLALHGNLMPQASTPKDTRLTKVKT